MASKDWYDEIPVEIDAWLGWDMHRQGTKDSWDEMDELIRFFDWGEILNHLNPEVVVCAVEVEEDICLNCGEIVRMCAILDPHCVRFASPP